MVAAESISVLRFVQRMRSQYRASDNIRYLSTARRIPYAIPVPYAIIAHRIRHPSTVQHTLSQYGTACAIAARGAIPHSRHSPAW
eukprot:874306-Rhodomonas_salina.1